MNVTSAVIDRARGALWGLALGDALGMPTQSLSRDQVRQQFGAITALVDSRPDQPIAPNTPAGSVTDDTEQALIVAKLLLDGGGLVEALPFAHALIAWEADMIARGSLDLLGPSTKAAISALQQGTPPNETGRFGTTNGAAMRVAPVGIAWPVGPRLLDAVIASCQVTHHTSIGISAAAAIAAAVSSGVGGARMDASLDAAVAASNEGESCGHWIAGASIPARFTRLRPIAAGLEEADFTDFLYTVIGTSVQSQESVVSALLIADRYRADPFAGLCAAASMGGDTDTVAAMAGAILGAHCGLSRLPEGPISTIAGANDLPLNDLADRLVELRLDTSKEN